MIGYVSVGSNDLPRAAAFYDALLGAMGAGRAMDFGQFILWGKSPTEPMFALCTPYDKQAATVGNGVMVALSAKDQADVDQLYAKAMELGAQCEGKPGPRGENFYAAYFRDLDGNKLNVFHFGP